MNEITFESVLLDADEIRERISEEIDKIKEDILDPDKMNAKAARKLSLEIAFETKHDKNSSYVHPVLKKCHATLPAKDELSGKSFYLAKKGGVTVAELAEDRQIPLPDLKVAPNVEKVSFVRKEAASC